MIQKIAPIVVLAAITLGCKSPEDRLFRDSELVSHWNPPANQEYSTEVRVAPDLIRPPQVPLQVGFWNSTARVAVKGKKYTMMAVVNEAWNPGRWATWKDPKPAKVDIKELGFWRLKPQYFASPPELRLGKAALAGEWSRVRMHEFVAPEGSRIICQARRTISLPVVYHNPSGGGGGAIIELQEPRSDWKLADIGIQPGIYAISMVLDDPMAIYEKKPTKREDLETLSMHPVVLAEEVVYTVLNKSTEKISTVVRPTGWIVGTGVYTDNRKN